MQPDYGGGDTHDLAALLMQLLVGADTTESFLSQLARAVVERVPRAVACGVSVSATEWSRLLGAASDDVALRMDGIQYDVGDGPCLTALRDGVTVSVDDLANDPRWPEFARQGVQEGVGTSLSVPMHVAGDLVGALNIYGYDAHALSDDHQLAHRFAEQASAAVAPGLRLADREEQSRHLEKALQYRSAIDQAIGILMARLGIDTSTAFEVLRYRSQNTNVKLHDVAKAVIAEVTPGEPT